MARKKTQDIVQTAVDQALRGALSCSNLYRQIADRLATGRWYDVDWTEPQTILDAINSGLTDSDDYILVSSAAFATIRQIEGYVAGGIQDEVIRGNVHGWLDSGVEVRVFSRMPHGKMVIGSTPPDLDGSN